MIMNEKAKIDIWKERMYGDVFKVENADIKVICISLITCFKFYFTKLYQM